MRKYEPAWIKLKQEQRIVIIAHNKLHPRILKAVIKEKDMDIVLKLELSEKYERLIISHTSIANTLTITTTKSFLLPDF